MRLITAPGLRLALLILAICSDLEATAGLSEWSLKTPGGNYIWCCGADSGIVYHGSMVVPTPRWWQHYQGAIAGETEHFYFIFSERSGAVEKFADRAAMDRAIQHRRFRAVGRRRTGPYFWESPGGLFTMGILVGGLIWLSIFGGICWLALLGLRKLSRRAYRSNQCGAT